MAQMKEFAVSKLNELFPGHGIEYEDELYRTIQEKCEGKTGWDFFKFRSQYKRLLQNILENMNNPSSFLKDKLENKEWSFGEAIRMDNRSWVPKEMWPILEDQVGEDEQEVREGMYPCGNCARKGVYARNTSHREVQTRSADEPATIFLHCHTCGKDYRFSS